MISPASLRAHVGGACCAVLACHLAAFVPAQAEGTRPDQASAFAESVAAIERELAAATQALQAGDVQAAHRAGRQALALAELDGASADRLAALDGVLWQLGRMSWRARDFATADRALVAVLRHREATLPEEHDGVQMARHQLAFVRNGLGQLESARDLLSGVLEVASKNLPDDNDRVQMMRGSLAEVLVQLGDLQRARTLQEKVLAVFTARHPDDHRYVLMTRGSLASTLLEMGELQQALELQQQVLNVRLRTLPPEHPAMWVDRTTLAEILFRLGDLQRALAVREALVAAMAAALPADDPELLGARLNLGTTLEFLGQLDRALEIHRDVLHALSKSLPDHHPRLQHARSALASTLVAAGDPHAALALETKVLEVWTKTLPEDHVTIQNARVNLAATMHEIGDMLGGLTLLEAAERSLSKQLPDDHPLLLTARSNIAVARFRLSDADGAIAMQRQVTAAIERSMPEHHPDRLAQRGNLASMLLTHGKVDEAYELQRTDLRIAEEHLPAEHDVVSVLRQQLAAILLRRGEFEQARALQQRTLSMRSSLLPDDHPDVQLDRQSLARTLKALGEHEAAAELLRTVATNARRSLTDHVVSMRAETEVAAHTSACLSAIARLLAPEVALPEPAAARLRAEGLRLLVASRHRELHARQLRRTVLREDADTYRRLLQAQVEATEELARAIALPADGRIDDEGHRVPRDDAITIASLAKDRVELEWSELVPARLRAAPEIDELADALAPDEAAVSFQLYYAEDQSRANAIEGMRYGAWVLLPSGETRWLDLAAEAVVCNGIERIRELVVDASDRDADRRREELLAQLSHLLFDPIRDVVPDGTRRLVLSMAYDLHLLPIAGLPIADDYELQSIWSLRTLLGANDTHADGDTPTPSVLAFGNIDYDTEVAEPAPVFAGTATPMAAMRGDAHDGEAGDGRPQRFTALQNHEADELIKTFERAFPDGEATLLRSAEASEAAFVRRAPHATYLHVTTHGYFAPDPIGRAALEDGHLLERFNGGSTRVAQLSPYALSGLAFAGANREPDADGLREGILTAQEVANLDLANCQLVTLSACETAIGARRGTDFASLRNALHAAGARFVLASLWQVSDREAERLMRDFYTRLWRDGADPRTALREAQLAARERRAPFRDWAGWTLTGR